MIRRALLLLSALLLLPVGGAVAADGSHVGIRPADPSQSWVVETLSPGATHRADAVLINMSDVEQTVSVGSADAITTADGVFTLAGDGEPRTDVGAWITPDAPRVTIGPREVRPISFTIRVPAGALPGDHAGGLLVRTDTPETMRTDGGVAVRIEERIGLRVYVQVPGARSGRVAIEDASAHVVGAGGARGLLGLGDGVDVGFVVRHEGNVTYTHLRAMVELMEGDHVVSSQPVDLGTVLPGDTRTAQARLPLSGWSTGGYDVRIRVAGDPQVTATAHVRIGAGRALGAGGLAIGGLLLGAAGAWRRVRRAS